MDSVEWLPFQNQSSPFISNIFVANEDRFVSFGLSFCAGTCLVLRSTVVEVQLPHPVYARYLRINSVTFLTNTGLRYASPLSVAGFVHHVYRSAEVYGCPVDSIPEAPQFTEGYPMVVSVCKC